MSSPSHKYIEVKDLTLHMKEWSTSGRLLLLMHSRLHSCDAWDEIAPRPHWIPWAFEAAYLQSLIAGGKKYQGGTGLVPKLAGYRAQLGLKSCSISDLDRLETILMGWHMAWVWDPEDAEEEPDLADMVEQWVVASADLLA